MCEWCNRRASEQWSLGKMKSQSGKGPDSLAVH